MVVSVLHIYFLGSLVSFLKPRLFFSFKLSWDLQKSVCLMLPDTSKYDREGSSSFSHSTDIKMNMQKCPDETSKVPRLGILHCFIAGQHLQVSRDKTHAVILIFAF